MESRTTFRSSRISSFAASISCGMGQSRQGILGGAGFGCSRMAVVGRFMDSFSIASPHHSARDRSSGVTHRTNGMIRGDSSQVAPCPRPRVVKICDSYFPVRPLPAISLRSISVEAMRSHSDGIFPKCIVICVALTISLSPMRRNVTGNPSMK
ncbi:hypothetical protein [Bacteroides xylanisolvens]|uniref:hypothetical protein n=2 Tax=Bacteroides TaxID=816 RepID=UPI0038D35D4D